LTTNAIRREGQDHVCLRTEDNIYIPPARLSQTSNHPLKVPKCENISLSFFAVGESIWICDLGTGEKNQIFNQLTPDFDGFWFFAAY
jgi:hypothetical protein